MERFEHHCTNVLDTDFLGNFFLRQALPLKEHQPLHDSLVWNDTRRLCLLGLNPEAKSICAAKARAWRYEPFETSDTFTDCICYHEEGQPIEDIELEFEHKLNEM